MQSQCPAELTMRTTDLIPHEKLRKRKPKPAVHLKWRMLGIAVYGLFVGLGSVHADFFKWEVLVSPEGWGTPHVTFPVTGAGEVYKTGSGWSCRVEAFRTNIESELLWESKTLRCIQGDTERTVRVVCTDNNQNRRYNTSKEDFAPPVNEGFPLDPEQGARSPYLLLRCFF